MLDFQPSISKLQILASSFYPPSSMYNVFMQNTFYSYGFGCRVNEAEKEEIDRKMLAAGFQCSPDKPSVYIINTCSVTHKAEREARQHIYQIKRKFPAAKIVITGCSATYWKKNNLTANLPVDEIFDNVEKEYLVELLQGRLKNHNYEAYHNALNNVRGYLEQEVGLKSKFFDSGRLLVKMQDGCQRYCSFCIVPYLRGMPKSVRIKEIVKKINSLRNDIVSEVILTAINTEAYGYDTGETFIDLLKTIIDKTEVPRISLGSIHPWSINDEFLAFYKKALPRKRIVDFFHIPIQSGSNKILRLMKRGYAKEEMKERLQSIKRLNDFAFIGTDVIVGFLDETDNDFEETYQFLEESPINRFHVFRFSKRQNTAAYYLSKRFNEVSDRIKKARARKLSELGIKKYQSFLEKHLDKTFSGLFLKTKSEEYHDVLLSNQIPALVKTGNNLAGEIKSVKITEYKKGRLLGKIL